MNTTTSQDCATLNPAGQDPYFYGTIYMPHTTLELARQAAAFAGKTPPAYVSYIVLEKGLPESPEQFGRRRINGCNESNRLHKILLTRPAKDMAKAAAKILGVSIVAYLDRIISEQASQDVLRFARGVVLRDDATLLAILQNGWLGDLAAHRRLTRGNVVDQALVEYAERHGFTTPPPPL